MEARVGIEQGFVKFTTPKLPSHHQRRVTHNYRTSIESGIATGLSSTRDYSKRKQQLLAKRTEEHFTLALSLALFPPCKRGEGRFGILAYALTKFGPEYTDLHWLPEDHFAQTESQISMIRFSHQPSVQAQNAADRILGTKFNKTGAG